MSKEENWILDPRIKNKLYCIQTRRNQIKSKISFNKRSFFMKEQSNQINSQIINRSSCFVDEKECSNKIGGGRLDIALFFSVKLWLLEIKSFKNFQQESIQIGTEFNLNSLYSKFKKTLKSRKSYQPIFISNISDQIILSKQDAPLKKNKEMESCPPRRRMSQTLLFQYFQYHFADEPQLCANTEYEGNLNPSQWKIDFCFQKRAGGMESGEAIIHKEQSIEIQG